MKNKYMIPVLGLAILAVLLISAYFLYPREKFIGKIVSDKEYSQNIFSNNSGSLLGESDMSSIKSSIRTLCKVGSVEKLLGSNTFLIFKKTIFKKIEPVYMEKFLYVDLPALVYNNCGSNIDPTFSKQLLNYLQYDGDVTIKADKEYVSKINALMKNLQFTYDENNATQLKTSSEYFDKIFFRDNLDSIKSVYFSDYMINKTSEKDFFYSYSAFSLTESNAITEKLLKKFNDFIKSLGLNGIEEFRSYVLKHNNLTNVSALKVKMIANYDALSILFDTELKMNLASKLLNIDTLYNFYISDDFKKLKSNEKTYSLFNELGKQYLYFSILNTDYADGLDEGWSGKEFFGDSVIGNGIIRIGYIYIYDSIIK